MFNFFKSRASKAKSQQNDGGFTMIEVVLATVMVMTLIAIALVGTTNSVNSARSKTLHSQNNLNTPTNPRASSNNIVASQTNIDPKNGPVEVDSNQYEQCEGINLAFYAYTSNVLLSMSNNDPVCS